MNANAPLSIDDFEHYVHQIEHIQPGARIAVATSGGADSLCLAFLTGQWAQHHRHQMTAVIVDHGLRPESTQEALSVQHYLQQFKIQSVILTWQGPKPLTRLQETARRARYELMIKWCQDHHYAYLFLGHHAQDQRETVLERLHRGSTVWGLAGMSQQMPLTHDLKIYRPLLNVPKTRIDATVQAFSLKPVSDPSNSNEFFARVRMRNRLYLMPELPIEAFGRLRQAFVEWLNGFIQKHVLFSPYGYMEISKQIFDHLSFPFQEIVINHLLSVMTRQSYFMRQKSLKSLMRHLTQSHFQPITKHGCVFVYWHDKILITREAAAIQNIDIGGAQTSDWLVWDDRFKINVTMVQQALASHNHEPVQCIMQPLGAQGWQQICALNLKNILHHIPYFARLVLPVLWDQTNNTLVLDFLKMYNCPQFDQKMFFQWPKPIKCADFLIGSCKIN